MTNQDDEIDKLPYTPDFDPRLDPNIERMLKGGTPDTLQEKLRDIHVTTSYEGYNPNTRTHETTAREVYLTDDAIAQILQALTDAGYIDASRLKKVSDLLAEQAELLATMTALPTYAELITESQKMTGQEFYDRFKAELNSGGLAHVLKGYESDDIDSVFGVVETVAKRAAGITENQEAE